MIVGPGDRPFLYAVRSQDAPKFGKILRNLDEVVPYAQISLELLHLFLRFPQKQLDGLVTRALVRDL